MQIVLVRTEKLIPYIRNPRKNDAAVKGVAASIKEFGFQQPIVIDKDSVVVAGHTRLKAAESLGLKTVPCVVADELTPEQVKAYRLLDNKLNERADWDAELLPLELGELTEFDFAPFDVDWGLDESTEADTSEDVVPEPPKDPFTKRGDVWRLGEHRVLCGDSTNIKDAQRLMGGKRADLCLTDPPYGLGDSVTQKNNYVDYDDSAENLTELIPKFLAIAQDVAPVVVLTPGNRNQRKYPEASWMMAWFIPAGVGMGPWGFCCWQPILCFGKDPKLANGLGSHPDAIVHTETSENFGHPCTKPIKFWSWLMDRTTAEGAQLVYDPFLGSGTTVIAAERLGNVCYGLELSPQYCDVICQRFFNETGEVPIRESDGAPFPVVHNGQ